MIADRIIFAVVVIGSAFAWGMDYGSDRVHEQFATTCAAQAGERLISTVQDGSRVICGFANGYGRSIKWRPAR